MNYYLIGESPSFKTNKTLFKLLESAGIPLNQVKMESLYENDHSGSGKEIDKEISLGMDNRRTNEILSDVEKTNPRVVLLFGNKCLEAFTGHTGIESWRGSVLTTRLPQGKTQKVIPTFDPSLVGKGGGTSYWYTPATIFDLVRAKGEFEPFEPTIKIVASPEELEEFFRGIGEGECSFDIETAMQGGERIKCMGFSSEETGGVVVNFEDSSIFGNLDTQQVIKEHMESGRIKWVAQNGYGFDINYLWRAWGVRVENFYFDTMVAHHLLHPEFPHDLGTLTSFYTLIPFYKNTASEDLLRYNGLDAVATYQIYKRMREELRTRKLERMYFDYYHPLLTPLREMSKRGIRINQNYQKELKNELKKEIKTYQEELDKEYQRHTCTDKLKRKVGRIKALLGGDRKTIRLRGKRVRLVSFLKRTETQIDKLLSINVRSTKALGEFLYRNLGLPVQSKRGKQTTDETAINKLFLKTGHPFLKIILKLREVENNLSKYGEMKVDEDGMVRTTYSFAETGRLRSGKFEAK